MKLRVDEQLSQLHLSGIKQALSQQQEQETLYQDMSFEERLQLLLSHELVQREQRKINRLEKQALQTRRPGGAAGLPHESWL